LQPIIYFVVVTYRLAMRIFLAVFYLGAIVASWAFTAVPKKSAACRRTISSRLYAGSDAPKKATKKASGKKATSKVSASKNESKNEETFRKPEFIERIAEKTGMTKTDSEVALAAVLDVISEVSLSKPAASSSLNRICDFFSLRCVTLVHICILVRIDVL